MLKYEMTMGNYLCPSEHILNLNSSAVLGLTQREVLAPGFIFARYSLWLSHGCILVGKGSDLEDLR